jgi:hypothetical protein
MQPFRGILRYANVSLHSATFTDTGQVFGWQLWPAFWHKFPPLCWREFQFTAVGWDLTDDWRLWNEFAGADSPYPYGLRFRLRIPTAMWQNYSIAWWITEGFWPVIKQELHKQCKLRELFVKGANSSMSLCRCGVFETKWRTLSSLHWKSSSIRSKTRESYLS